MVTSVKFAPETWCVNTGLTFNFRSLRSLALHGIAERFHLSQRSWSLRRRRALERMGGETSHCPSETCDARNPPKILRRKCQTAVSLATVWHPLHCLFMDEEVDELGDRLEDLGIEIGVEFLYYAELCETFRRIKKLGSRKSCSSLVQAVAIAHLDLQVIK